MIKAYAAQEARGPLNPIEYDPGPLGPHHVEIDVDYCGICHSDLSMLDNEWQMSQYPLVPGHEIVGKVAAVGENVAHLQKGQTVGLGWFSQSCMNCFECMSGDHNLCLDAEATILGRHGGFADKVRAHSNWVIPLPKTLDPATAGPLFCGGITIFNPIVQHNIQPTDHVGVVGIGGLGHLALQYLRAWGCEVTAFSTSPDKKAEAKKLGAHHFISPDASGHSSALSKVVNTFDMILVTVNVELDWEAYVAALRPRGRLHIVGAAPKITTTIFPLITGQKSISGSPLGSPATLSTMLDFTARHKIAPQTETYPLSEVNKALEKLRSGKPRYRLVLKNDFA